MGHFIVVPGKLQGLFEACYGISAAAGAKVTQPQGVEHLLLGGEDFGRGIGRAVDGCYCCIVIAVGDVSGYDISAYDVTMGAFGEQFEIFLKSLEPKGTLPPRDSATA